MLGGVGPVGSQAGSQGILGSYGEKENMATNCPHLRGLPGGLEYRVPSQLSEPPGDKGPESPAQPSPSMTGGSPEPSSSTQGFPDVQQMKHDQANNVPSTQRSPKHKVPARPSAKLRPF